jgi:hypothetical protein
MIIGIREILLLVEKISDLFDYKTFNHEGFKEAQYIF